MPLTRPTNTFQRQINTLTAEQTRQDVAAVEQARQTNLLLGDARRFWLGVCFVAGFFVGVIVNQWISWEGYFGLTCFYGVPC
ncbi:MAG: hypothetical protein NVS2B16_25670 [Chloroflexota bacterium]